MYRSAHVVAAWAITGLYALSAVNADDQAPFALQAAGEVSVSQDILPWQPVAACVEEPCFPLPTDAAGCHSTAGCGNCRHVRPLSNWLHLSDDGDCWLHSDQKLLHHLKMKPLGHWDDVTYSAGGELRFRYLDERNRLRPPLAAGRSSYQQWRFTPYLQLNYQDWLTGYVQAIEAPTFNEDLPQLPIDENRADLLQYYVDLKLWDFESGDVRFRYGRQFLNYGSQHLISPLAWANTYRNFEGYKLYYAGDAWNIDAFAVQPVNGAAGNTYRPTSFDTPDQSRWFGGVYATYKELPHSVVDLYWLWLKENDDRLDRIDGNRHTIGVRWAGSVPHKDDCGDVLLTWVWDVEGAYQFGKEDFSTGLNQDIEAGFLSLNGGATFNQFPWTPTLTGIYFWGSGDKDPTDGKSTTVNTLFPLGHAYWGLIDNFSGQNLIDYAVQVTVKPTRKLTFLTAWHWFDKAAREDAIYNIAGAPFGGVSTTPANIGNELDLVATYQMNANLQIQMGYFWFWYGAAVSQNPNAAVADRKDAEQFYLMIDWAF